MRYLSFHRSYKGLWKLKLKVLMSAINWCLFEIFIRHWVSRNSNKHKFCPNYVKTTIQPKIDNFRQIIAKINRVLKKIYTNNYAKFQSDRCNLFRVIARQKNRKFSFVSVIYFCFLNIWLSKALNWSQKSSVKFHHFLCLYMIYIEKKVVCRKCMYVCLCVCLCVSCQFFVAR